MDPHYELTANYRQILLYDDTQCLIVIDMQGYKERWGEKGGVKDKLKALTYGHSPDENEPDYWKVELSHQETIEVWAKKSLAVQYKSNRVEIREIDIPHKNGKPTKTGAADHGQRLLSRIFANPTAFFIQKSFRPWRLTPIVRALEEVAMRHKLAIALAVVSSPCCRACGCSQSAQPAANEQIVREFFAAIIAATSSAFVNSPRTI